GDHTRPRLAAPFSANVTGVEYHRICQPCAKRTDMGHRPLRGGFPLVVAGLLFAAGHFVAGREQRVQQRADAVVLPPIDRGLVQRLYRAPDSLETRLRASIRSLNGPVERMGRSGSPYVAGRLIVKFRAAASRVERDSALSANSAEARAQPSYADFDVVTIDPGADAEAAADALASDPAVEYAQPAYRVHAEFKPNDPLYPKQWNLPDIDMERAWDIQPGAGSSITVAVVDTGVAYTNVTRSFHASAFRVDADGDVIVGGRTGTLYPSLGDLTLSFVGAP